MNAPITIFVIDLAGEVRTVSGSSGQSIMESIRNDGIGDLAATCGGQCSCATCHVYFDNSIFDQLGAASIDEEDLLDGLAHRTATSRLSCQIVLSSSMSDMTVTIAPND